MRSFSCLVSPLNEALLRAIANGVPKLSIEVRTGEKPWNDDRLKQRQYRVLSRSRTQAECEEYTVARWHAQPVFVDVEQAFTEEINITLDECTKSMEVVV